ncbi:MAG: helix-turn-helix transcriptional regulator [Candidatus Heimdallarchaeota archaeon]|nr:MAG: helix-turn-helix transcriptional regulator [Candidatus Heimdallarchaeota archaeon]
MAEDRQKLFDYWKYIPSYKFITVPEEKYYSHPVRRDIIRLLRKGVDEKTSDGKYQIRRALNVTEINNELMKIHDVPISKTTLYFHLNILIELGLIQVVTTLLEGPHRRNKTKYFGRVARNLFISIGHASYENYKAQFDEFQKFAKIIGLKLPDNYPEIPRGISEMKEHFFRVFGKWLIEHEELIEEAKIDFGLLYDFLKNVNSIHPNYRNLLNDTFLILQNNIQDI